jgi:serine/threonine protein kinase
VDDLRARLAAALGDGYRIRDEVGGGGMSRVLLAEEVHLGREVVVKVLPPELSAGVNAERFRREIQLAARLQHPGRERSVHSDRCTWDMTMFICFFDIQAADVIAHFGTRRGSADAN